MAEYSPELEAELKKIVPVLDNGDSALVIFDDMAEVNERFQATLDWFKDNGNKMRRRFGNGAFMKRGMLYFVGADVHRPTRGVEIEVDLRPYQEELVRQVGLEARLRKKGLVE